MKTYKILTQWIGYSEIELIANSYEEAQEKVLSGNYCESNEISTGQGLEYGYDHEEILDINEI